jgi:hypothetical protein
MTALIATWTLAVVQGLSKVIRHADRRFAALRMTLFS